jgi:hypothetical protein
MRIASRSFVTMLRSPETRACDRRVDDLRHKPGGRVEILLAAALHVRPPRTPRWRRRSLPRPRAIRRPLAGPACRSKPIPRTASSIGVEALARKVAAFRIGDSGIEGAPREVADELNGVRSLLRVVATRSGSSPACSPWHNPTIAPECCHKFFRGGAMIAFAIKRHE